MKSFSIVKDQHGQPLRGFRANLDNNISKAVDQLAGICKGILADGIVHDQEAVFFREWIANNSTLESVWPWADIYARVDKIFRDGIVDEDERKELKAIMEEIIGVPGQPLEPDDKSTSLPLDNPQPLLVFPQSVFCITGRFAFGTRARVFEAVSLRGGIPKDTFPSKDTQYLVIGTFASRDWIHTNYGRKIERAMELKSENAPIAIVSEEHWRKAL